MSDRGISLYREADSKRGAERGKECNNPPRLLPYCIKPGLNSENMGTKSIKSQLNRFYLLLRTD